MFSRVSVFGSFAPQIGPPRPRVRDNQLPRVRFIDNGPGPRSGDRNRIDFLFPYACRRSLEAEEDTSAQALVPVRTEVRIGQISFNYHGGVVSCYSVDNIDDFVEILEVPPSH